MILPVAENIHLPKPKADQPKTGSPMITALIPFREQIKKELTENHNYPKLSAPRKYGDYYYFTKNTGLQNQDIIYRMKNPIDTGKAELFVDPNSFAKNGSVSLQGYDFSPDGSLFAYLISNGGSDWREIVVKDVHTATRLVTPSGM
jgi:prolyl oligopeptidase